MTNYVWSATDKSGNKVLREIAAATAEDARFVLASQGYTDLVLQEDEISSAVQAGFAKRTDALGLEIKATAEARQKHRDDPTATWGDALRKGIVRNGLVFFSLLFFAGYYTFRERWWQAGLFAAALLALVVYILVKSAQSVYYRKLILAVDWYQWHKVLTLVNTLKTIGRYQTVKLPATELARHRARALAGLGRLDEALAELKQCEGQPDSPDWLYQLFIGSIYTTAKQYDRAIACNLASLAAKPTATAWLDLAYRYARYKHDPAKARAAFAEAEKSPVTDQAKPFQLRCQGVIAWLEGNHADARRELEASIALIEPARGRPFRDGNLAIARAYLSCVLAKQGDLAGARKCLAAARRYLVATKEDELLAECRQLCDEK